jgi:hypothetical protein
LEEGKRGIGSGVMGLGGKKKLVEFGFGYFDKNRLLANIPSHPFPSTFMGIWERELLKKTTSASK